jgi:ribonuclease R
MKDKVGERFNGVVAAVAEPGLFVELRPYAVEGLVKTEDLPGDFELDPVQHALVDRRTRRAYRVGDEIEVDLVASSPQRRQIDLRLAGTVAAVAPPEGPKGPRERLSMPPRSPGAARPAGKGRGAPKGGHGERGGRTRSGNGHAEKARTGGGQGGKKGTGGGHKGRRRGR